MRRFFIFAIMIIVVYITILKIQGFDLALLQYSNKIYVIAAIIILLIVLILRSFKYNIFLVENGINMGKEIFPITIFGFFSNFISPVRINEIAKSYVIKKKTNHSFLKILSSSIIDSFMDIVALITVIILFSSISLTSLTTIDYKYKLIFIIISIFIVFSCIYVLGKGKGENITNVIIGFLSKRVLKNEKIDIKIFIGNSKKLILNRKLIVITYLIGIFIWIMEGLKLYFLALAFNINISLEISIFIISLAYMVGGALINPSGIMQETVLLVLLLQLPFQKNILISIGSMDAIITVGPILLIGTIYMMYLGTSEMKKVILSKKRYIYTKDIISIDPGDK